MATTTFPISVRSRIELPRELDRWMRAQLATKLDHAATLIQRATVRLEDLNGPKGGIDIACRIDLAIRNHDVVHAEERAGDPRTAFHQAMRVVARALNRARGKHQLRGNRRGSRAASEPPWPVAAVELADSGELIGRRTGRGPAARAAALDRPEKRRRDAYVDTSLPGVSASDRRAGGTSTARRNSRARTTRATAMLEDSRTRPSRKSTRKSANRGKPSQGKERTAVSRSFTPAARAARRS